MTGPAKAKEGLPLREAFREWTEPDLLRAFDQVRAENPRRPRIRTKATAAADRREKVAVRAALIDFIGQLAAGDLVATGFLDRVPPIGDPVEISPDRWRLSPPAIDWQSSRVEIGGQKYEGVRIRRPAALQPNNSSARSATACEQWLRDLVAAGPQQRPKLEYREEALARFEGLSGRGFDRVWANATNGHDKWGLPGRRPK